MVLSQKKFFLFFSRGLFLVLVIAAAEFPQAFRGSILTYFCVIERLIDFNWQVKLHISCVTH